jgi:hypothetical protein
MENREAIELLKGVVVYADTEYKKALTLAIAALEQQEKDRWRPVSDGMPEEHKWIGTEHFGTTISDEVYVTIEVPSGERIAKHMHFQNGSIPPFEQRNINTFYKGGKAVAWRPLPEPYQEDKA